MVDSVSKGISKCWRNLITFVCCLMQKFAGAISGLSAAILHGSGTTSQCMFFLKAAGGAGAASVCSVNTCGHDPCMLQWLFLTHTPQNSTLVIGHNGQKHSHQCRVNQASKQPPTKQSITELTIDHVPAVSATRHATPSIFEQLLHA